MIQPPGVCQVVSRVFVPGSYPRPAGTLIPNGPSRKLPAPRSSSEPNTLGASNRGTHSQSIVPSGATSAPVWQSDRNAYWAIGGNGEGGAAPFGRPGFWGGPAPPPPPPPQPGAPAPPPPARRRSPAR